MDFHIPGPPVKSRLTGNSIHKTNTDKLYANISHYDLIYHVGWNILPFKKYRTFWADIMRGNHREPEVLPFVSVPITDLVMMEMSFKQMRFYTFRPILQARLQQYVNHELPGVQAGFRKGRETRDQIANIRWIIAKAKRVPEKHLLLLYWLCQSLWPCWRQQTMENSSRDGNTRPPYLPLEKSACRSGSNS